MDPRIIVIGTFVAIAVFGVALAIGSSGGDVDTDDPTDGQVVRWPTSSDETLGGITLVSMDGDLATFKATAIGQGTFLYWVGPGGAVEDGDELTKGIGEIYLWKALFGADSE